MSEIVSIDRDGAARARESLERCVGEGGVAVFPADTLYGLACDPLHEAAIARIHELKGRDEGKPSAVMYFSPLAMRELISTAGPRTRAAIGALLPGPVTLVIANPGGRYPLAGRDDPGKLGVRLIEGPLSGARCALFQTSANRSGDEPPARFEDIGPKLLSEVDLAIDGGRLGGEPSTVVDVSAIESGGEWRVLREGAVAAADIDRRLHRAVD